VGLWQQVHVSMMKHAHRVMNLANEDVNLVGTFDNMCSYFCGSLTLITFEFACDSIHSFGETSEQEGFFSRCCSLHFIPCLWLNFQWIIIVYQSQWVCQPSSDEFVTTIREEASPSREAKSSMFLQESSKCQFEKDLPEQPAHKDFACLKGSR